MRHSQIRNKSKDLSHMVAEKPSITVERSYEVSFDYCLDESETQPAMLGGVRDKSRPQSALTTRSTYRAEASIGQPSTARDTSDPRSGHTDPVCPAPIVRRSQDKIDLHEALRSQLPPFRQSRRWAKTYLHNANTDNRPITAVGDPIRKKRHVLACDVSQQPQASMAANSTVREDNEVNGNRLCGPAYVPSWQVFKHHRLGHQYSMPARIRKLSAPKSPKRIRSSRSLRARIQATPRQVMLPRVMQNKNKVRGELHGEVQDRPKPDRISRLRNSSQHSLVSTLSKSSGDRLFERSASPVSSLHDFEKVKRFSRECVDMLSGLDFGEEWRLSILSSSLSELQKLSNDSVLLKEANDVKHTQQVSASARTAVRLQTPDAVVQTPTRTGRRSGPNTGVSLSHDAGDFACDPSIGRTENFVRHPMNAFQNRSRNLSSHSVFAVSTKSSTSSFDQQTAQTLSGNLKNASSIDTLTKIEAQVDDPSNAIIQHLKEKTSSFTLSSSPKRQRPSGEPPQKPLPELPKDDVFDSRSTSCRRPSFASSRKSKPRLVDVDKPNPLRLSLVHTIIAIPSDDPYQSQICNSTEKNVASGKADSYVLNGVSLHALPTSEIPVHRNVFPTLGESMIHGALVQKDTTNNRSSKIQEMKKRDIAAWNISQEAVTRSGEENCKHHATSLTTSDCYSSVFGLPQMIGEKRFEQTSNHNPNPNKPTDTSNPALNISQTPTAPLVASFSDSHMNIARNEKTSHELARTSSHNTCTFSQKSPTKQKKLNTAVSTTNLQQQPRTVKKPKQALGRSQIMVVVDTNPHTSTFRAGAASPSPSLIVSNSRPASPAFSKASRRTMKTLPRSPAIREQISSAEFDCLPELVDVVRPPLVVQKRRSSRGFRSQESSVRSSATYLSRNPPACSSPLANKVKTSSKNPQFNGLNSSDSELEHSSLPKQNVALLASQTRNRSRVSSRSSHRRKDTPLTSVLKEEVRRADQELENLKKYEKRIEYLQLHLEQTLKVWGRMSQNGKRQYLTTTFGGIERQECPGAETRSMEKDAISIAASSIYSQSSSIRKIQQGMSRSLSQAITAAHEVSNELRRVSGTSTSTTRGTDTDTDTDQSAQTANSTLGKRTSGGSLTDPHDYDLAPSLCHSGDRGCEKTEQTQQPKHKSSNANINNLRARLQAARGPPIPARRCRLKCSPRSVQTTPSPSPVRLKNSSCSPTHRFAVAPWEEQEEVTKQAATYDEKAYDSDDPFGVRIKGESLRTDQMDAMLAL